MLCGFGSTIGMDSVNAKVVHITGRELYFIEKFQRAILTTSSIITFHWVYALFKRKNYIEFASNSLTGT
jgi:hypothetical protein